MLEDALSHIIHKHCIF